MVYKGLTYVIVMEHVMIESLHQIFQYCLVLVIAEKKRKKEPPIAIGIMILDKIVL